MAANTAIYGILGANIDYTLSPAIFRALFTRHKIDAVYNRFDLKTDQLKDFLVAAKTMPIAAFNVTIPYKEVIFARTDRNDEIAKATGSVNLVTLSRGKLLGHNTDYLGIAATIESKLGCAVQDANVTLIGSGGAARTAYYFLVRNGAGCVSVVHRSAGRKQAFSNWAKRMTGTTKYKAITRASLPTHLDESNLVINCTPAPIAKFLDSARLKLVPRLFEMRYDVKDKPRLGHVTGEYMLAVQAAENFRIITGIRVNAEDIMKIIKRTKA